MQHLPVPARKLLGVIARQAHQGTLRSKAAGVATMPEVHEACGLDPDQMGPLLATLLGAGFIEVAGDYPFEEIKLMGSAARMPLGKFVVETDADSA